MLDANWQELYKAALFEFNANKLATRVQIAETRNRSTRVTYRYYSTRALQIGGCSFNAQEFEQNSFAVSRSHQFTFCYARFLSTNFFTSVPSENNATSLAGYVMPNSDSEELSAELLSLLDKQLEVLELSAYVTLAGEEWREFDARNRHV